VKEREKRQTELNAAKKKFEKVIEKIKKKTQVLAEMLWLTPYRIMRNKTI
jgi:hypothetical protein